MSNKKYYNNGINENRFDLDESIPDGWVPGRICSSATTTGCIWINNGIESKFLSNDEPIPDGWVKGRLKSHINSKKSSESRRSKHYHHYTNGVDDLLIADGDTIPNGYYLGRPPMSNNQKEKLSIAHTGLHHTDESKKKISEHSNNNRDKAFKTIISEYGSLDNYYAISRQKSNKTKLENGTFNTSKPEKQFYNELCESYGNNDVLRQYKEERYPFHCDFYIKSEDLFIELNLHWTHGGKPYDPDDEECQKQLATWQEKAKTSQFYANAIKTWTERDVEKQRVAKENNLNYKVMY